MRKAEANGVEKSFHLERFFHCLDGAKVTNEIQSQFFLSVCICQLDLTAFNTFLCLDKIKNVEIKAFI